MVVYKLAILHAVLPGTLIIGVILIIDLAAFYKSFNPDLQPFIYVLNNFRYLKK